MTPTAAVRSILGDPSGTLSEARCREVVVAVLRACREPSEGMVAVGIAQAADCTFEWTSAAPCVAEHLFPAMIDALIEEVTADAP